MKISFLQKAFVHKVFRFENIRWISQCFRLDPLNANGILESKKSKSPRGVFIGIFQVLGSFREPLNSWTWRNYTFETETWLGRGETIPLKLKLELCETSKFLHIIICTSDTIFLVGHLHGSSYNLMYWISLNDQIRLTREENILFQVFSLLLSFHDLMDAKANLLLHIL